jgi:hypothetical protein
MLTGLYPSEHGIYETQVRRREDLIRYSRLKMNSLEYNILQKYKDENYDTVLISANSLTTPWAGFEANRNILIDPFTSSIAMDDAISIDEEVKKLAGRANFILYNLRKKMYPHTAKGYSIIPNTPNTPSEGLSKVYI